MSRKHHQNKLHTPSQQQSHRSDTRDIYQEGTQTSSTMNTSTLLPKHTSAGSTTTSRNTWRVVLALVIGMVIGFALGALAFRNGTSAPSDIVHEGEDTLDVSGDTLPETEDVDESGRVALVTEGMTDTNVVLVKDQTAGTSVFLSRVEMALPGWVAVQEDADGEPGAILGAQRFDAGVYQGTVRLLRATESGKRYHTTVWSDNGDKMFDFDTDTLIADAETMEFEAY